MKQQARAITAALLVSLILPVAVIVKNGVYFDVWSIGTGSGTGLFYGLSPHRNGAEPVYSNFSYDADVIPYMVDPTTKGHPLAKSSDAINQAVALEIVKQTHWRDNVAFLAKKLRMWLFTSTPELYINPKLRWIRLSEWLIIACFLASIIFRRRHIASAILPGDTLTSRQKALLFTGMLAGVVIMASQLSPVLYNTRYASYFIEPWLLALTGWSVSYLILGNLWPINKFWRFPLTIAILAFLISAAYALTQHALRREIWEIDPHRPGPTTILVPSAQQTKVEGEGMQLTNTGEWLFTHWPATLHITLSNSQIPSHEQVRDAMWRMQFAVQIPDAKPNSQCTKATLAVQPHQPEVSWYVPPPLIFVRTDGKVHAYIISANGANRPQRDAKVSLTFRCPEGSRLTWEGIELRESTLTKAAAEFLLKGTPINPYLPSPD